MDNIVVVYATHDFESKMRLHLEGRDAEFVSLPYFCLNPEKFSNTPIVIAETPEDMESHPLSDKIITPKITGANGTRTFDITHIFEELDAMKKNGPPKKSVPVTFCQSHGEMMRMLGEIQAGQKHILISVDRLYSDFDTAHTETKVEIRELRSSVQNLRENLPDKIDNRVKEKIEITKAKSFKDALVPIFVAVIGFVGVLFSGVFGWIGEYLKALFSLKGG